MIALIIASVVLRENIITRRTSIKPLLFPGRIKEFISDDNLFSCNFDYPISEDIGVPKLVYFGINNIGKGPASNVRVISFRSEEKEPILFRAGSNVVRIPEGGSIPFVIRIARKDESDYHFVTYHSTISYEDIFGNLFYLSVRLWINEQEVVVIEYNDEKKPIWTELENVVWREVEGNGYFEMRKLESLFQRSKDI